MLTYRIQSTVISSDMSSVGSPADDRTINIDTMPACGMPAAPVLTAVTIKLNRRNNELSYYLQENGQDQLMVLLSLIIEYTH